jgi:hypothetical protein
MGTGFLEARQDLIHGFEMPAAFEKPFFPEGGADPAKQLLRRDCRALKNMERETGIGPATNSLEGCDSTIELLPLNWLNAIISIPS